MSKQVNIPGREIQVGDEVLYLREWRKVTEIRDSAAVGMMLVQFAGENNIYLAQSGFHDVKRKQSAADLPVGTVLRRIGKNFHMVKVQENAWIQFFSGGGVAHATDSDDTLYLSDYEVVTFDV